jgi:hypothetical protein
MTDNNTLTEKKGILIITRYFPPLDSTATSRMYSWAKYLSRSGFHVSVLTTSKKGQVVTSFSGDTSSFRVYEVDYFDPITCAGLDKKATLMKLTSSTSRTNFKKWLLSGLSRLYRERLNERLPGRTDPWIFPAIKELKRQKKEGICYNYVLSSYGPPSSHIVGFFAKKFFNAHWIADYRDLWLENHIYVGVWPFTWLERWIEKKIISRANAITSVSRHLAYVLQRKFPHVPASVIENGFDDDEIESARNNYFPIGENKFRIAYTGSIYRGKRDPVPFFRAVEELISDQEIDPSALEILFWGSTPEDVVVLIQKHQLSSVARYCGAVSKQDALSIQKSAHALLFLEWSESEHMDILTAKIFEYLAADRPIIGIGITSDSSVGRLIHASGSGIACGNDTGIIKDVIVQLLNNSLPLKKDWNLIRQFSRESEVNRLIQCLRGEVVSGVEF